MGNLHYKTKMLLNCIWKLSPCENVLWCHLKDEEWLPARVWLWQRWSCCLLELWFIVSQYCFSRWSRSHDCLQHIKSKHSRRSYGTPPCRITVALFHFNNPQDKRGAIHKGYPPLWIVQPLHEFWVKKWGHLQDNKRLHEQFDDVFSNIDCHFGDDGLGYRWHFFK